MRRDYKVMKPMF